MEKKAWYQSKTLWANALGVLGVLFSEGGAFGHVFAPDEVAAGFGVLNMGLRFLTERPVGR